MTHQVTNEKIFDQLQTSITVSGEQHAKLNDISDISDRIAGITKQPTITLSEKNELGHGLKKHLKYTEFQ